MQTTVGHVFISYKTEDRERAQRVRAALALRLKCEVWWDQDLQTGGSWADRLDVALQDAACVMVLWSYQAVKSPWVLQEASVGKALAKLVPAVLDRCDVPAPYRSIQTAALVGWDGSEHHPDFVKFANGVKACIETHKSSSCVGGWLPVAAAIVGLAFGSVVTAKMVTELSGRGGGLGYTMDGPSDQAALCREALTTVVSDEWRSGGREARGAAGRAIYNRCFSLIENLENIQCAEP